MPVQVNPPIIGYVDPDSPEAKLGIQPGDEILSVDGKPITSWHDVQETTHSGAQHESAGGYCAPGQVHQHLRTDDRGERGARPEDPQPRPARSPGHQDASVSDSAAEAAGLKAATRSWCSPKFRCTAPINSSSSSRSAPGRPKDIVVKRDGERTTLKVTPRLDPSAKVGRIGAEIGTGKPIYRIEHIPPWVQIADGRGPHHQHLLRAGSLQANGRRLEGSERPAGHPGACWPPT